MQVQAIQRIDVLVSKDEQKRIAIESIRQAFGLSSEEYLEDGKIEVWHDTGHGSGLTDVIREATEEDVVAFKAIEKLKEYFNH